MTAGDTVWITSVSGRLIPVTVVCVTPGDWWGTTPDGVCVNRPLGQA